MRPRRLTIKADNEAQAKKAAAEAFETEPSNIQVLEASGSKYLVAPINMDAELEIKVGADHMTAKVTKVRPAEGEGKLPTLSMIGNLMREAGVGVPPDMEACKELLSRMQDGKDVVGIVLAEGIPPKPAQDARIEPIGNWKYPVFPADAFGTYKPSKPSEPGKDVTGKKISPGKSKGQAIEFPKDANCYIDTTTDKVRSKAYGMVTLDGQKIRVRPMIEVSRDAMEVTATIFTKDFRGESITHDKIRSAMESVEVTEPLDAVAVTKALGKADDTKSHISDVVICRGIRPKEGKDGYFDMFFKDDTPDFGKKTEDGRIDFRARNIVRSVRKGDILGKLIPPTKGTPGRDVYGRIIPARDGEEFPVTVGENVETSAGGAEFKAADDGMVFFASNTLAVSEIYVTPGDVNMATGNITVEKGSIHVKGNILSGFSVISPRNVVVNEVIESAYVQASGTVEVRGGILMDREGIVKAGGGVTALFAKNATIEAKGDVDIAHEINNCYVSTDARVIALKGRGKIIGSTIRAGEGVLANEIGTELGVETTIYLGQDRQSCEEEVSKRKELKLILQKIYSVLGSGNPEEILKRALPEKRQAVAELLKARLKAEKQLREIEKKLEEHREKQRQSSEARIKVRKVIYPGTKIHCFGATLKVTKEEPHSQAYYDYRERKIVIQPL